MINSNDDSQKNLFDLFNSNSKEIEETLDDPENLPVFEKEVMHEKIESIALDDIDEENMLDDDNSLNNSNFTNEYEVELPTEIKREELIDSSLENDISIDDSNSVDKKLNTKIDDVNQELTTKSNEDLTKFKTQNEPRKKQRMTGNRKAIIKENKTILPPIKVIGVGGGGSNAVSRMMQTKLAGVQYLAVNTDLQALNSSEAEGKVQIGTHVTRGLGAGSDPLQGRRAADESREVISDALNNAEMVFVTACLGGGTGTGAAPVIAEVARELGALTIGVVTKPFIFEGSKRRQIAEEGIRDLQDKVDTLIVIPNDRLLQICGENASIEEGFETADDILRQAIQGISELITKPGLINLDFADIRKIMTNAGPALMAIGSGRGENRAVEAARNAIANPLLEVDITGSTGVLFNITGPSDFTLKELDSAARVVAEVVNPDAEIIFGAAIDNELSDEVKLTIIATGFGTGPSFTLNELDNQEIEPIKLADLQLEDTRDAPSDLPTFLRKNFPLR